MLGSLVAVPAAALFWPSFPTTVDSLLASVRPPKPEVGVHASASGWGDVGEAPRFEPSATRGPLDFAQTAPTSNQSVLRQQGIGLPTTGLPASTTAAGRPPLAGPLPRHEQPRLIPVGQAPSNAAPGEAALTSFAERRATEGAGGRVVPRGMQPTSLRDGVQPGDAPRFAGAAAEQAQAATSQAMARLQDELRRRGVTYSLLETWGAERLEYRFHCKAAVAGNTRYYRNFEAIDADPLTAMRLVLGQIESWQSGRSF